MLFFLGGDCGSGADEAGDRLGGFPDLLGRAVVASGHRLGDAVAEVLLKQQATGTFAAGTHQYGLQDGAVRILPFSQQVPAPVQARVAQVQALIVSGKLAVPGDNGVILPGMVNC